jgi:hypothetical protein
MTKVIISQGDPKVIYLITAFVQGMHIILATEITADIAISFPPITAIALVYIPLLPTIWNTDMRVT